MTVEFTEQSPQSASGVSTTMRNKALVSRYGMFKKTTDLLVFESCAETVLPGYRALVADDLSSELDIVHNPWPTLMPDADFIVFQQVIANDDMVRAVYGSNLGAWHTDLSAFSTLKGKAALLQLGALGHQAGLLLHLLLVHGALLHL